MTVPSSRIVRTVLGGGGGGVQLLSCVQVFATPWTAAHQASLPSSVSQSLLKLMSLESVMLSNHLVLCWLVVDLRQVRVLPILSFLS